MDWKNGWIEKAWGRCRTLLVDDQIEIVEAEIVAGGYSSIHKHLDKDNTFIVITGELEIQLYPALKNPDTRLLRPNGNVLDGETITVLPFVPHKFIAHQATRLIEIYRACHGKPLRAGDEDIIRMSEGGVRK